MTEVLYPKDFHSGDGDFGPDSNISATIGWIAIKFGLDIHVRFRMKCINFFDA